MLKSGSKFKFIKSWAKSYNKYCYDSTWIVDEVFEKTETFPVGHYYVVKMNKKATKLLSVTDYTFARNSSKISFEEMDKLIQLGYIEKL